jgi:hypothetical protein
MVFVVEILRTRCDAPHYSLIVYYHNNSSNPFEWIGYSIVSSKRSSLTYFFDSLTNEVGADEVPSKPAEEVSFRVLRNF